MTRYEFLTYIQTQTIETKSVNIVEKRYDATLPNFIKKIISCTSESIFFDDGWRTLSVTEIIDAPEDLHIDFITQRLLPLFDTDNNDFIVYHLMNDSWSKFNIIDECHFKNKKRLEEFFE